MLLRTAASQISPPRNMVHLLLVDKTYSGKSRHAVAGLQLPRNESDYKGIHLLAVTSRASHSKIGTGPLCDVVAELATFSASGRR